MIPLPSPPTLPIRHVVFGQSGAGSLRVAVKNAGRNDEVIGCPAALNMGPINPATPDFRRPWLDSMFGMDDDDEREGALAEKFFTDAIDPRVMPVAWLSRRDAGEYAAYLEFIWRLGSAPAHIVDITNVALTRQGGKPVVYPSFQVVHDGIIVAERLFDRATPLPDAVRAADRTLWARLRRENAPVRIATPHGLESAPIDQFDDLLRSCVMQDWQSCARVINAAEGKQWDTGYVQTGDVLLRTRLRALVERGEIEGRGDIVAMRAAELRLKPPARG